MANEWFIQHGGKQYGPLASANLKKLAAEGKITPSTLVRLGTAGNWVPAARVQGLFAASASAPASAAASPRQTAVPQPSPLDAPPAAPPSPPPMASPLARAPLMSLAPVWKAAAPADGSIAAKITGAVGLIFGILALATFWLPMLGGLMGWTGIVVGALGLLLGIGGMVLSAMQQGSGLYLNVAGTSSAAVGLVLTIVLGVTFGLFTSAPAPAPVVVVQKPALPPAEPPPVVQEAPPKEPEPPPEPVWTDAGQAIEQGPIKATIASAGIENIRLESMDLSTLKPSKPKPMLKIRVAIENTTTDRIVDVPGWLGTGGLLGQGVDVGAILKETGVLEGSEAGKMIQSASATAKLTDNVGNNYPQTPAVQLFGAQAALGANNSLRPGNVVEKELVFEVPLESIEYLRLELSPAGFGGVEPLRFQIQRSMVTGL
ncbi:MAG: DUF4339 domain-containing protein [Pirellulales bacterium]